MAIAAFDTVERMLFDNKVPFIVIDAFEEPNITIPPEPKLVPRFNTDDNG